MSMKKALAASVVILMLLTSFSVLTVSIPSGGEGTVAEGCVVTFHNGEQTSTQTFVEGQAQNLQLQDWASSTREKVLVGWSNSADASTIYYSNGQDVTLDEGLDLYPVYRTLGTVSDRTLTMADDVISFDLSCRDVDIKQTSFSGSYYASISGVTYLIGMKGESSTDGSGNSGFAISYTRDGFTWSPDNQVCLPTFIKGDIDDLVFIVYQSSHYSTKQTTTESGTIKTEEQDRIIQVIDSTKRVITFYETGKALKPVGYTTGNNDVNNVEGITGAWSTTNASHKPTSNGITVTGGSESAINIVLDGVWSNKLTKTTGAFSSGFIADYRNSTSLLNIILQGECRFPSVQYGSLNGARLVFSSNTADGSLLASSVNSVTSDTITNYWNSAIGALDSSVENAYGIYFNSGTVYAGTTKGENCTAIGAGGNGAASVFINGGTVYAVAHSTGTAIGGGIGYTSKGGVGTVVINKGTVYAYNGVNLSYEDTNTEYIPSAAIGGGSSRDNVGSKGTVTITGGTVTAYSVGGTAIGGGGSSLTKGGEAEVVITEGTVTAKSLGDKGKGIEPGLAIGGGTSLSTSESVAIGGNATLTVTGGTLIAGSIGGGSGMTLGTAKVYIHGGIVKGQVVMNGGIFQMTDGKMDGSDIVYSQDYGAGALEIDGGAIHINKVSTDVTDPVLITGGTIMNYGFARDGGAIYVGDGDVRMGGSAQIIDCEASGNGGAVYLCGGFVMDSGLLKGNTASGNGGAVYVDGKSTVVDDFITSFSPGSFTMRSGEISGNVANNGGGVYINGIKVSDVFKTGSFRMENGKIYDNTINPGGEHVGADVFVLEDDYNDPVADVKILGGTIGDSESLDPYFVSVYTVFKEGVSTQVEGRRGSAFAIRVSNESTKEYTYTFFKFPATGNTVTVDSNSTLVLLKDMDAKYSFKLEASSVIDLNGHVAKVDSLSGTGYVMDGTLEGVGSIDLDCSGYVAELYPQIGSDGVYRFYRNVTVTYVADGVSGDIPATYIGANYSIKIPAQGTMVYGESVLLGWNTKADGKGDMYYPGNTEASTVNIHDDLRLYAIWTSEINITYCLSMPEGGVLGRYSDTLQAGTDPVDITLPTADLKTGYRVCGWTSTPLGGVTVIFNGEKMTLAFDKSSIKGSITCTYQIELVPYYLYAEYGPGAKDISAIVIGDTDKEGSTRVDVTMSVVLEDFEEYVKFAGVAHVWDCSDGKEYNVSDSVPIAGPMRFTLNYLSTGNVAFHVDGEYRMKLSYRGVSVDPDGLYSQSTFNLPDVVVIGSGDPFVKSNDVIFVGWEVLINGNLVVMGSGSSFKVEGNCIVSPILVPSSQYHATITLGNSGTSQAV